MSVSLMKRTVVDRKKPSLTKAGVHKFRLPGRVGNKLCSGAWYLWDHGIELALCHASGAYNFEVVPIFVGNMHTHEQQIFYQYIYIFFFRCLSRDSRVCGITHVLAHLTTQFNECSWCLPKHRIRCEISVSFIMNVGFVLYHILKLLCY